MSNKYLEKIAEMQASDVAAPAVGAATGAYIADHYYGKDAKTAVETTAKIYKNNLSLAGRGLYDHTRAQLAMGNKSPMHPHTIAPSLEEIGIIDKAKKHHTAIKNIRPKVMGIGALGGLAAGGLAAYAMHSGHKKEASVYLDKVASLFSQAEHAVIHTAAHGMENQKNYPEESVTKRRFIGMPFFNKGLKSEPDAAINNTNTGALISVPNRTL